MSLFSRIAKKLRRRTRAKGMKRLENLRREPLDNAAKRLFDSFWGMGYAPERVVLSAARKRAFLRLKLHRKQWANTPDCSKMTRQRIRQDQRIAAKA